MSRHDGAIADYEDSAFLSRFSSWIFWANIPICLFSLSFPNIVIVSVIQIVLPILFFLLSFVNDHCFWYPAEQKRRKLWLSDGYACSFCSETTDGYYNNGIQRGFLRLAADAFESSFFTKRIAKRMSVFSLFKGVVAILVFVVVCVSHINYKTIVLITQTVFSGTILANYAKHHFFYWRVKKVYELFFMQFITEGILCKEQLPSLLDNVLEYECLKSFYQIRLSPQLFQKMNPTLSREWAEIAKKLRIAPSFGKTVPKC